MSGIVAAVAQKKAQQKTPGTAQRRDASSKESRNLIGINSPSSGVKNKFMNNQDGPMNGKMKKADLEGMITAAQDGTPLTEEEKSFLQRVVAPDERVPEACSPEAVDAIVSCWAGWMASRELINAVFKKNAPGGGADAVPEAALLSCLAILNGEASKDENMVRQVSGGLIRQVSGEGPKVGDADAAFVKTAAATLAGAGVVAAIDQKIAMALWFTNVAGESGGCCVIS